jgi:type II secretory pathway component GspD/PulD (secretin)
MISLTKRRTNMNLSLKSLTIALAASASIAFGQDAPQNPAAAVEKTKEVVAAVKEVAADAEVAAAPEVAAADAAEAAAPAEAAAAPEVAAPAEAAADAEVAAAPEVEDKAEVAAAATADVPDTEEELDGVTVTSGEDPDKITVSLDAVELEDVVRLFTRLSGANIICNTTNLHGTVTANLANIGWKPALKAILRQQGLALMEDPLNPDVYEIGVPPPAGREPFVSKTFKLNYLKATEAATILRNFLGLDANAGNKTSGVKKAVQKDKDGKVIEEVQAIANEQKGYVVAHPAANTVIVSCRGEDKMREVEKVIADLDVVRQQVYIEAKIVQVSGEASKKIGIDWSILDGYTISAGPFARQYTKTQSRNVQTTSGGKSTINWGGSEDPVASTIVTPATESSAATFSPVTTYDPTTYRPLGPVSLDGDSRFGDLWDGFYRSNADIKKTPVTGEWSKNSEKSRVHGSEISDIRTAIFEAPAFQVALSALETSDDVAQISNPKLIVANEEPAVIDMTTKDPYVELSKENNSDNNSVSYSAELKEIPKDSTTTVPYIEGAFFTYGIRVDVTPRINNASNITVVIEPMISSVTGTKEVTLDSATDTKMVYPILDVKRVRTTFSLGDGQTAVIGGLTTTGDKEIVKRVPLLGSIPILKYLFSHTEKVKQQIETIIFVTVGIVDPDNRETTMGLPDGARLVQKRIDENGRIIDKRFKDLETDEQKREADLREAEAARKGEAALKDEIKEAEDKGLVVPEVVEE